MAQILVRNIEESVKRALMAQAALRGHSMEEEARIILRENLLQGGAEEEKLGTWFIKTFKGKGLDAPIAEMKGFKPKIPKF